MERHIKWQPAGKYTPIVRPGALRFLDFGRLQLAGGDEYSGSTGDREYVLDFFSGSASVAIEGDGGGKQFKHVGKRPDVFSGAPVMIYIPSGCSYSIKASGGNLDVGFFSAAAKPAASPAVLEGTQVIRNDVGRDNWRRAVYSALDERFPAERLLAGETLNPPGNWSSYPPHKHDRTNPPQEAVLEEIYFFRVRPAQGFGFMWTYTAPGDADGFSTVFQVHDGDTVLIPKGYHPVVAAPGYELHYAWVLAGEERRYGAWSDDPQHAWVKRQ
jgi:5-deoxy-glucuronate isomerase